MKTRTTLAYTLGAAVLLAGFPLAFKFMAGVCVRVLIILGSNRGLVSGPCFWVIVALIKACQDALAAHIFLSEQV